MDYVYHFLVVILTCAAIGQITGQEDGCVPGFVENLRLSGDGTLSWNTPETEACSIAYYVVYIGLADSTVVYTYTPENNALDVSFLIPCYSYTFRIHQVSTDDVTGQGLAIFETTGPPSDANLQLESLFVTRLGTNLQLNWSLEEQWVPCARRYRVLIYNEDSDIAEDFYTALTSLMMFNLVPCAQYTFGITALFTLEEEGPVSTIRSTAPENPVYAPQLISFSRTTTSARLTFHLEDYQFNRCPITSLRIAGPAFTIAYPITNQPNRTPFTVTIAGLNPDTMYVMNVTANNTAGWSPALLFGVQTLESP